MSLELTQDTLRAALWYDRQTGAFRWRRAKNNEKISPWSTAGCYRKDGYLLISIGGKLYLGHRLAWLYVHGSWPSQAIDHINGDCSDNRISNLRDVSQQLNVQNIRSATSRSKSRLLGVTWRPDRSRWRATIVVNKKQVALGHYDTAEEASQAYLSAKRRLHEGGTL